MQPESILSLSVALRLQGYERNKQSARAPHARSSLLFCAPLTDFQGGRDAVASWVDIQQQRPPLYLLPNVMVFVAAHNPCRGGGGEHKEEGAPQRAQSCGAVILTRFTVRTSQVAHSRKVPHRVLCLSGSRCPRHSVGVLLLFSASSSSAEVRDEPEAHNSTPIIVRGDGLCASPCRRRWVIANFRSRCLPNSYLCLWGSGVCSLQ